MFSEKEDRGAEIAMLTEGKYLINSATLSEIYAFCGKSVFLLLFVAIVNLPIIAIFILHFRKSKKSNIICIIRFKGKKS